MVWENLANVFLGLQLRLGVRLGRYIVLLRLAITSREGRRIGERGLLIEVTQLGVAGVGLGRIVAIGRRVQEPWGGVFL
jgi:hypothetical protein